MDIYEDILRSIAQHACCKFAPASTESLSTLKKMNFPEALLNFYANYEPVNCEHNNIRIHNINNIVFENTELCPGCISSQYGYFVFAASIFGDVFCFDTNRIDDNGNPRIVFLSHELIWDESTEEDVHKLAVLVADNFLSFLRMLHRNEIQDYYE